MQGLLIAVAILAILGVVYLLVTWWNGRVPDIGAPIYPGSRLENTILTAPGDVTYHLTTPATRESLFAFYQNEGATCGEGMCYGPASPCGDYYAYISGTTQGVTRIALEVDTSTCDQP
jgi:hypothetical protein